MDAYASGQPSLIEPVPITDDFVQGIAKIETVGPCARFVLFAEQTIPEAEDQLVRVIVRKIVVPIEVLPTLIHQAVCFLAAQTVARISNVVRLRH